MEIFWTQIGGVIPIDIIYINTIITPDQPTYKTAYLEDRGYGYIGPTLACDVLLQLSYYRITTDQSIWPFPE